MSFSIILFFNLIFNLIVAQSFNVYANTFKTVLPFGPDTLNPYTSSFNNSSRKIRSYIHESLLDRDLESNEFIPRLAVSWEISPNHREIIFNLRKNVLFSDGSKLSASDVKFSFESLFNDSYQAALLRTPFELIEKCEILNDYQIKFTSKKADYYQFQNLALELKILSKKFYENLSNQKNFHQKLIGTGPYLLKDVEVNSLQK